MEYKIGDEVYYPYDSPYHKRAKIVATKLGVFGGIRYLLDEPITTWRTKNDVDKKGNIIYGSETVKTNRLVEVSERIIFSKV